MPKVSLARPLQTHTGYLLQHARLKKGLVQTRIAQAVGVSQATVSAWEQGTQFPREKHVHLLASALEIDEGALLNEVRAVWLRRRSMEPEQFLPSRTELEEIWPLLQTIISTGMRDVTVDDVEFLYILQQQLGAPLTFELVRDVLRLRHRLPKEDST